MTNPNHHPETGSMTTDTSRSHERATSNANARALVDERIARMTGTRPTSDVERVELLRPLAQKYELIGPARDRLAAAIDHVRAEHYRAALDDLDVVVPVVDEWRRNAVRTTAPVQAPQSVLALLAAALGVEPADTVSRLRAQVEARTLPSRRLQQLLADSANTPELRRCVAAVTAQVTLAAHVPALMPSRADWFEGLPRAYEQADYPRWHRHLAAMLGVSDARVPAALEAVILQRIDAEDFLGAWWARQLRLRVAVAGVEQLNTPDELSIAHAVNAFAPVSEVSAS